MKNRQCTFNFLFEVKSIIYFTTLTESPATRKTTKLKTTTSNDLTSTTRRKTSPVTTTSVTIPRSTTSKSTPQLFSFGGYRILIMQCLRAICKKN